MKFQKNCRNPKKKSQVPLAIVNLKGQWKSLTVLHFDNAKNPHFSAHGYTVKLVALLGLISNAY